MKKILVIDDSSLMSKNIITFLLSIFKEELKLPEPSIKTAVSEKEANDMIDFEDHHLITLDGNLAENGHGINVLKKMDKVNKRRVIVISTDEFFLSHCKKNNIPAFDKSKILESEADIILAVKKIIERK